MQKYRLTHISKMRSSLGGDWMFKQFIDISRELFTGIEVWPGDPEVQFGYVSSVSNDGAQVMELRLGTHSGTHIDAPAHFIEGAMGIDEVPLSATIGPCLVIDLTNMHGPIDQAALEIHLPEEYPPRLLLKTSHDSWQQAAYLNHEGARFLVESGVKLVGTEEMSIEQTDGDGRVHKTLLDAGVAILEGIDLQKVAPGPYVLLALPLRLKGADGSPCRAVLGVLSEKWQPHVLCNSVP